MRALVYPVAAETIVAKRVEADIFGIALLAGGCFAVLNVHLGSASGHTVGDLLVILAGLLIATNAFVIRYKLGALHKHITAFHNVLYSTIPFALSSCWEKTIFVFTPARRYLS